MYIHEHPGWWNFRYDAKRIIPILAEVRNRQGRLLGIMGNASPEVRHEAYVDTLCDEIYCTTSFSGRNFDKGEIKKAVNMALGRKTRDITGIPIVNELEGEVQVTLDSSMNYKARFNERRLFAWCSNLFPTGYSGLIKIESGKYRTHEMQAAFGTPGEEKIYYEAPAPERIPGEMQCFFKWFESGKSQPVDYMLRAAIAYFWILTIHPFEDGNGRIARAISDLLLSRSDKSSLRYYSPNITLVDEREKYYGRLKDAQNGDGDLTEWIMAYLQSINRSMERPEILFFTRKSRFWSMNAQKFLNIRQISILNDLLEKPGSSVISSTGYARLCGCSQDTALRDLHDLIDKGLLKQSKDGGRNATYILKI
ncbi:MAG: DUF4172 domain-containing protein [Bacteroidales bacterium]|jgi:Fic family protein|nr:DUF4172 domain-containing protein [Bacteroidales bacterium]MCI2145158.1 DUF4172 domain-containing protein [Bacteroidales bacterium]